MSLQRGRFVLIAVACIVALALLAQYQIDPRAIVSDPLGVIYRILQLFALEGDWASGDDVPFVLKIARIFAPIVTLGSIALLFAEGLWASVINAQIRWLSGHIVIIGLSDAAMLLIRHCRSKGSRVVVIERFEGNRHLAECRALRIPVLVGSAKRRDVLLKSRLGRAGSVLSFIDSDDENIELALQIRESLSHLDAREAPLKVSIKVRDMQLAQRLEDYPKFFDHPQRMEVRFFNLEELAARMLFRDYAPEVYADALGADRVHVLIVGFTQLGRHVLATALKQGHYGDCHPLQVTVLDPDADQAREVFTQQAPEIELAADVRFVGIDLRAEVLRDAVPELGLMRTTMVVCCQDGDSDNLTLALALRRLVLLAQLPDAPIFVALRHSRGLARLVETKDIEPEIPDGLYPFGMQEHLMRAERMIDGQIDEIAMGLHQHYLDNLDAVGGQASHRPWSQLPEMFRSYSRSEADHMEVKLRAAGLELVDEPTDYVMPQASIERLAEMEKARWNAERAYLGWRHGTVRSDLGKVHPQLKPWSATDAQERSYELSAMRELPNLLSRQLELGVAPTIVIGVTGHRAHRLEGVEDLVASEVRGVLRDIATKHSGARFTILSALADGSDRLVAELAMEELDAKLVAVLPLPYEIYKATFSTQSWDSNRASDESFQSLVGRASRYFELPLRFGGVQTLERSDSVGEQARAQQFALGGAYVVARSHEMIAIWDGQESRGLGGTAQVVEWRTSGTIPAEFAYDDHFFAPVAQTPPYVVRLPEVDG